jgi:OmpA-OmpF porin, OOP family
LWRSATAVWLATATLIACAATAPALRPAASHDGVPDPTVDRDRDGDGVADRDDSCRDEPEDRDGFEDTDGCPELDNDHDRIRDAVDKCPNEPENYNSLDDDDGCPDKGLVSVGPGVAAEILFADGQAEIASGMNAVLDAMAARVIAEKRTCHLMGRATDDEQHPVRLAEARVAAVKTALLARGVPPEQISVHVVTATVCNQGAGCRRVYQRVTIDL